MRLGATVVAERDRLSRGVVVWFNGSGIQGHRRMFDDDLYVIEHSPGTHTIGNAVDEWRVLLDEEQTAYERVLGAIARWEPPEWDDPAEADLLPYAILDALHPGVSDESEDLLSFAELALRIADRLQG